MGVRVVGEGNGPGQEALQDMDDLQIKICKIEQLTCLVAVEILGLTEVHQVLMISEDLDREWGTVEIVSPGLQGMDDGKEFLVIDVIVPLCWDEQLGEIGTRVPIAIGISL